VKEEASFGIFLAAGIVVGLAVEALDLIVADGFKNYPWPPPFAVYLAVIYIYMFAPGCLLAFWIGTFCSTISMEASNGAHGFRSCWVVTVLV
jgi:hypothetical protein